MLELTFIVLFIIFFIHFFAKNVITNTQTCDKFKLPHKWIVKYNGEDSYLVCERCKMLPGGDLEEGNK